MDFATRVDINIYEPKQIIVSLYSSYKEEVIYKVLIFLRFIKKYQMITFSRHNLYFVTYIRPSLLDIVTFIQKTQIDLMIFKPSETKLGNDRLGEKDILGDEKLGNEIFRVEKFGDEKSGNEYCLSAKFDEEKFVNKNLEMKIWAMKNLVMKIS